MSICKYRISFSKARSTSVFVWRVQFVKSCHTFHTFHIWSKGLIHTIQRLPLAGMASANVEESLRRVSRLSWLIPSLLLLLCIGEFTVVLRQGNLQHFSEAGGHFNRHLLQDKPTNIRVRF